jgi:hypothetical protein
MSDSKPTAEPLSERIAHALGDRRPPPSSDFEARLERACERPHRSLMTGLIPAALVACAILIVVVVRPDPAARAVPPEPQHLPNTTPPPTPPPKLPHDGRYSTNQCNQCHRPAPPNPPTIHQPNGAFPLDGAHRSVACATCHTAGKAPQRECSSCHVDPHRGTRGTKCAACHLPPGSWKTK